MAKPTEAEKFWAKVDRSGGPEACWPWQGYIDPAGYGMKTGPTKKRAHRYAWISARGPIPDGLVIDHVCHNGDDACAGGRSCLHRRCCNPAHLEPVTSLVNVRRAAGLLVTSPDACGMGHPLEGSNVFIAADGRKRCVECASLRRRRYRLNHPDKVPFRRRNEEFTPWIDQQRAEGRTLRQIRDDLAARGVVISHETVRSWSTPKEGE